MPYAVFVLSLLAFVKSNYRKKTTIRLKFRMVVKKVRILLVLIIKWLLMQKLLRKLFHKA